MNVLDVNVLIALYFDDHEHHARAREWWRETQDDDPAFAIPDLVWVGFLRLVTNRRVFVSPARFEDAWSYLVALTADPGFSATSGDDAVLRAMGRLGVEVNAQANLVTDTYIAAVASSLGATVVTFDRDFRKFDNVRVHEPR